MKPGRICIPTDDFEFLMDRIIYIGQLAWKEIQANESAEWWDVRNCASEGIITVEEFTDLLGEDFKNKMVERSEELKTKVKNE